MTQQDFSNYSVVMDLELNLLEEKIKQVVEINRQLREENHQIRLRLASLEGERRRHSERIKEAKARLENILVHLPQE